ncbi:hypothetical protein EJ06DRAFT_533946 [Trichodelitschia bisporula]|uniref:Uncharacterized protein n=1 Tax=Trichodelitschia bisporula TaxID=703511 RepID=A0A6G1HLA7_9PEZI|nr:hypothetical protein EJ06DRAFT_533946 [Trichodelitschia bisporula]
MIFPLLALALPGLVIASSEAPCSTSSFTAVVDPTLTASISGHASSGRVKPAHSSRRPALSNTTTRAPSPVDDEPTTPLLASTSTETPTIFNVSSKFPFSLSGSTLIHLTTASLLPRSEPCTTHTTSTTVTVTVDPTTTSMAAFITPWSAGISDAQYETAAAPPPVVFVAQAQAGVSGTNTTLTRTEARTRTATLVLTDPRTSLTFTDASTSATATLTITEPLTDTADADMADAELASTSYDLLSKYPFSLSGSTIIHLSTVTGLGKRRRAYATGHAGSVNPEATGRPEAKNETGHHHEHGANSTAENPAPTSTDLTIASAAALAVPAAAPAAATTQAPAEAPATTEEAATSYNLLSKYPFSLSGSTIIHLSTVTELGKREEPCTTHASPSPSGTDKSVSFGHPPSGVPARSTLLTVASGVGNGFGDTVRSSLETGGFPSASDAGHERRYQSPDWRRRDQPPTWRRRDQPPAWRRRRGVAVLPAV